MNATLVSIWRDIELAPLREDAGGTLRVGPTRLSLDLVIENLELGRTPEEMLEQYPFRSLDDILGAIAFYHANRDRVEAYLAKRKAKADELQAFFESRRPPLTRTEMIARWNAREAAHAPPRD